MLIHKVLAAGELGDVDNPLGVLGSPYGEVNDPRTGLNAFVSNALKMMIVVGGLFATVNILLAGFAYITANGDQQKIELAGKRITYAAMGLGVMVLALILTGAISWILFGNVLTILQPAVYTP